MIWKSESKSNVKSTSSLSKSIMWSWRNLLCTAKCKRNLMTRCLIMNVRCEGYKRRMLGCKRKELMRLSIWPCQLTSESRRWALSLSKLNVSEIVLRLSEMAWCESCLMPTNLLWIYNMIRMITSNGILPKLMT